LDLIIRKAEPSDADEIWEIFHEVVVRGDAYTFDPATTRDEALAIWMSPQAWTYVATCEDEVVGSYFMRRNQPGLGSHVVNAGYMVKSGVQGKGIGRAMCEHSFKEAKQLGFLAMQYNMVVSTNESAVSLWKKMGFEIVGTLPKVFRHRELGLVDAYVMHRFL
jgi:L-amino acid N-acyltransferase YncA